MIVGKIMTVQELIDQLTIYPGDSKIICGTFEIRIPEKNNMNHLVKFDFNSQYFSDRKNRLEEIYNMISTHA